LAVSNVIKQLTYAVYRTPVDNYSGRPAVGVSKADGWICALWDTLSV